MCAHIFFSSHLQRLNEKKTLEEGDNHRYQPAYGTLFPKFESVQHCEISWHNAGGYHQQPTDKDKPPGEHSMTAQSFFPFAITSSDLCWTKPESKGEKLYDWSLSYFFKSCKWNLGAKWQAAHQTENNKLNYWAVKTKLIGKKVQMHYFFGSSTLTWLGGNCWSSMRRFIFWTCFRAWV